MCRSSRSNAAAAGRDRRDAGKRALDAVVVNFKADQRWTFDWIHIPPEVAGTIKIFRELEVFADAVSVALRNEISRLHPGR
jgi:hypothetical protein